MCLSIAILSLLGYNFHGPSKVIAGSPESRSLMEHHPELTSVLQDLLSSPPHKRGPWSKGTQGLISQTQEACKTLLQVSLSEPSALSLGPYVSICLLVLRPWLGLLLAHVSGCPDTAVTVASGELCLPHLGAPQSSRRNLTHKQSIRLQDNGTL